MRWLAAGLTLVNVAAVWAVIFGMIGGGLNRSLALLALLAGAIGAILAFVLTGDDQPKKTVSAASGPEPAPRRSRTSRRRQAAVAVPANPGRRYRNIWLWFVVACFAVFAIRSFCFLLYIDGNELKVQSPNNLGDLSLHLTYIRQFASGTPLWPDNPIYVFSKLRYPAGTDLFNALLTLAGVDIIRGLVWAGLLGCAATCYALYRWAGTFGIAAFLFNGGVAGFRLFHTWDFLDYQGDKTIAWKSLALSMLVTQRGVLYAFPVGLLLLYHWRSTFFPRAAQTKRGILPLWLEISLYATMPLFHVHTFLCLSLLLAFFFVLGDRLVKRHTLTVVAIALVPATFFTWLISDHFHAGSVLQWKPGWVNQPGSDFAMPFPVFWLVNFGAWLPAVLALLATVGYHAWKSTSAESEPTNGERGSRGMATLKALVGTGLSMVRRSPALLFLTAATAMFLLAYFVKTAPWEWDNMKIIVWAYFIVLPFLWKELIAQWPWPARSGACLLLFSSGFITLIGGLGAGRTGFGIAQRSEVDPVGLAVRHLPVTARFAVFPTYNHPILLQGRKAVLGYPGHLWTQGFNYSEVETKLKALMLGRPEWRDLARALETRYLFWGKEEKTNYAASARPWERELKPVASGPWGTIYDLQAASSSPRPAAR